MKRPIYSKVIVPAREAPDGETPTILWATEERNIFAIIVTGCDEGVRLIEWFPRSTKVDVVVERAVDIARDMIDDVAPNRRSRTERLARDGGRG